MDQGEKSEMAQERILLLDEIGFTWKMRDRGKQGNWQERCIELQNFKHRYGHCNVPLKYPGNPKLGNWCNIIRSMYTKFLTGKPSTLDENKIETLKDLGFVFNIKSSQKKTPDIVETSEGSNSMARSEVNETDVESNCMQSSGVVEAERNLVKQTFLP